MATIHIYGDGTIVADRDIEPPRVNWLHSVGGGAGVPPHDRRAHALGHPHECTRVRSGRIYRGQVEDYREARRALLEQYAGHTLVWAAGWERYDDPS